MSEGGRGEEKEEEREELAETETGGREEGPGREEKPESERRNIREVGDREKTENPKNHNWSKPELREWEC